MSDQPRAKRFEGVDCFDVCASCKALLKAGMIFLNEHGEVARIVSDPDEYEADEGYISGYITIDYTPAAVAANGGKPVVRRELA